MPSRSNGRRPSDDRLEDWPLAIRDALSRGLTGRLTLVSGEVWSCAVETLLPFDPHNDDLRRELRTAFNEQIIRLVMMNRERYPKYAFELVGLDHPAEGMGPLEYRFKLDAPLLGQVPPEDQWNNATHRARFAVRRMRAYIHGSAVFAEIAWTSGRAGVDRIVNPSAARTGNHRQDLEAARTVALVMLDMVPQRGPTRGTVKDTKYRTQEEWHAAIRTEVLPRETRAAVDDTTLAIWLGISRTTLYRLMERWGPSALEDLRNGNF
jgi:hypothetical protein